jgi:hypothetical protein
MKGIMNRPSIFAVIFGLMTTVIASQAGLGWTLQESIQRYGQPVGGPLPDQAGIGRIYYLFKAKDCSIGVFYLKGKLSRVVYTEKEALKESNFKAYLFDNAPQLVWIPTMDSNREWLACTGSLQVNCWAQLNGKRTNLVIATIEELRRRARGGRFVDSLQRIALPSRQWERAVKRSSGNQAFLINLVLHFRKLTFQLIKLFCCARNALGGP